MPLVRICEGEGTGGAGGGGGRARGTNCGQMTDGRQIGSRLLSKGRLNPERRRVKGTGRRDGTLRLHRHDRAAIAKSGTGSLSSQIIS